MAKAIMIQGTASNAGKSILTAALCRVFAQDGYKVAPFKSQNMSLNSFITNDGYEMGRAQVVQAEAAMREPDVRMNPILLKPTSDIGSQVIFCGEVLGNMQARDYYEHKKHLAKKVQEVYNELASENDIVVIEGAGSPAEINLMENDIVNMGMAKMAKAPVLLAGDIDRGGVFASLLGTYSLFNSEEKKYLRGIIINKFRGDKGILQPGIDMLYKKMPVPCVGVVPYMNVKIDDEDSLSSVFEQEKSEVLDIAVVRLPKISNFTDFNAFDMIGGIKVRYIERVAQFGQPDLLILPGTKNTIDDMKYLRESGFEARIKQYVSTGGAVFGICGGFQMLSETIADPDNVEAGGTVRGIGLLPVHTVFQKEKRRTRVSGKVENATGIFSCLNGENIEGYEIHMGTTNCPKHMNMLWQKDKEMCHDGISAGNVCGTYLHGFFDAEGIVTKLLTTLANNKGVVYTQGKSEDLNTQKQREYDKLASEIRKALDIKLIYEILERGV